MAAIMSSGCGIYSNIYTSGQWGDCSATMKTVVLFFACSNSASAEGSECARGFSSSTCLLSWRQAEA